MLQSIQFIGSGPPTYIYSKNAVGASGEYYHVFAAETRGMIIGKSGKMKSLILLSVK